MTMDATVGPRSGEAAGMVVGCAAYEAGRRVADIDIAQASAMVGAGRFVWIGLHEPSEELLRQIQAQFGLHDLAVEDAHKAHQRPKLEVYGDALFLVLRTAQLREGRIEFGETHIFAGKGYVVTVRHGPSSSYAEVRARCERVPDMLRKGADFVLYSLMDFIVDNYFPIVDGLETEVEGIEDRLSRSAFPRADIERIYDLKRDLLTLRRAVTPLLEMCNRMMRFDVPLVEQETYPYFRDVHDHVIRLNETIDNLRELLASALEANLLLVSVRQNEVVKKLAGWGAILAVPTALTSIYGMNFALMPELGWRFGYPAVMATVAAVCGYLYYRFRRAGWL